MGSEAWRHFQQFAKNHLPPEENEFCQRWMLRGDQKLAEFGMVLGLIFYSLTLMVVPLIANRYNSDQLFVLFASFALAHALWLTFLRKTKVSSRFVLWVLSAALVGVLAYFQRSGVFLSMQFTPDEIAISCTSIMAIVVYLILLMPYSRLSVVVPTAIAYGACIIWSVDPMGFSVKWSAIVVLTVSFTLGLQIAKNLYRWQEARREFAALAKIAFIEREQMQLTVAIAEQKAKESQARYEAMARTTRMLAHDIRKPFSMVRALTRMLETVKDPSKVMDMVKAFDSETSKSIESVDGMINDILAISDHPQLTRVDTAVESLIEVALIEAFRDRNDAATTFSFDWSHRTLLNVDALKVSRGIGNIVNNAAKAVAGKGAIWFSSRDIVVEDHPFIELCIGNNGEPLPTGDPNKLFDAFFSSETNTKSLGLGLAIAQRFIDAHGGSIRASSLPEIGTRFWLTLPASSKHRGPAVTLPSCAAEITLEWAELANNLESIDSTTNNREVEGRVESTPLRDPFRLLLIEDEVLYADAVKSQIQHLLDSGGVALDAVRTSAHAYELCAQYDYQLILCDIDLGADSENGFTIVRKLRSSGCAAYIAMHSNRITKADAKMAIQAGADIHLPKPIGRAQLARLMAAISNDKFHVAG